MTALRQVGDTEDLGQHGAWRFTREYVVEPELTLVFYELYEAAFGPLRVRSVARQVLSEEEFADQMVNGSVAKYVAWGVNVLVETCTGGERGSILNPAMDRPDVVADLVGVRRPPGRRAGHDGSTSAGSRARAAIPRTCRG